MTTVQLQPQIWKKTMQEKPKFGLDLVFCFFKFVCVFTFTFYISIILNKEMLQCYGQWTIVMQYVGFQELGILSLNSIVDQVFINAYCFISVCIFSPLPVWYQGLNDLDIALWTLNRGNSIYIYVCIMGLKTLFLLPSKSVYMGMQGLYFGELARTCFCMCIYLFITIFLYLMNPIIDFNYFLHPHFHVRENVLMDVSMSPATLGCLSFIATLQRAGIWDTPMLNV